MSFPNAPHVHYTLENDIIKPRRRQEHCSALMPDPYETYIEKTLSLLLTLQQKQRYNRRKRRRFLFVYARSSKVV